MNRYVHRATKVKLPSSARLRVDMACDVVDVVAVVVATRGFMKTPALNDVSTNRSHTPVEAFGTFISAPVWKSKFYGALVHEPSRRPPHLKPARAR